jgi:Terminase large subunit, T4likevirus-type, N-terminal
MSSQLSISDAIKQELIKCKQDPVYFMKKYYTIQHPTKGRMTFNLFPFQEKSLKLIQRFDYCIINKSRQLGISTLTSAFALWMMLFEQDKNILVLATTQATAKNMVTKVRFAYDNLPSWMRLPVMEHNRLSLRLKNGSQIKAVSAATDSARSEAVSLLVIDEAAFIDNIDKIYTAAQQTLATGGRCIALSTPNGVGNWFHKEFTRALNSENNFTPINLPWTVHPERTQEWRDQQTQDLGVRASAQECDCDFSTSGDTVIEPTTLNYYQEATVSDPLERSGPNQALWLWEYPDLLKSYMIVADVARGDGKDFSTYHIIEIETLIQVGEFRDQLPTKDFARGLVAKAIEWNNALLIVENASIGWDVVTTIEEIGYPNLYYSPKSELVGTQIDQYVSRFDKGDGMVPGFGMNQRTRPLVVEKGRSFIEERSVVIRSQRTMDELRVFIWKNSKPQAMQGYNDDLVMPLLTGLFLRDTALRFRKVAVDLTYASLNNYSRSGNDFQVYSSVQHGQNNPWQMQIGDKQSDLTWLL